MLQQVLRDVAVEQAVAGDQCLVAHEPQAQQQSRRQCRACDP